MPILMTARYQIYPHAMDRCKKAIQALVEHVKKMRKKHFFIWHSRKYQTRMSFYILWCSRMKLL